MNITEETWVFLQYARENNSSISTRWWFKMKPLSKTQIPSLYTYPEAKTPSLNTPATTKIPKIQTWATSASKFGEGPPLTLKGVGHINGNDGLPSCMLCIGQGVPDHALKEDVENPFGVLMIFFTPTLLISLWIVGFVMPRMLWYTTLQCSASSLLPSPNPCLTFCDLSFVQENRTKICNYL